MQVPPDRSDERSLVALATHAGSLLAAGDLVSLHRQFGYALALEREPVKAVADDLESCLVELTATSLSSAVPPKTQVRWFNSNSVALVGLVECLLATNNGRQVLVEMVLTKSGPEFHLTLEQISPVASAGTANAA